MKIFLLLICFIYLSGYSQTAITNSNFKFAVGKCLETNPVDGLCSKSEYGAMPDWDVSSVTEMDGFFIWDPFDDMAESFNVDISDWDVSNVTDMKYLFRNLVSFNQDIGSWDVSKVTNMTQMFKGAKSFNQDISLWIVSNVTNMSQMFTEAETFNQDLSSWNVSNVKSMWSMFYSAKSFNQDISSWDVRNVTSCDYFHKNAANWTFSKPTFAFKCD